MRAQPVVEGHRGHHEARIPGPEGGAHLAQVRPPLRLTRVRVLGEVGDVIVIHAEQREVHVRGDVGGRPEDEPDAVRPVGGHQGRAVSHLEDTRSGVVATDGEPLGVAPMLGRAVHDPAREHEVGEQVPIGDVHVRRA